ncbi:hypothetical protein N7510_010637 [Penicillium lagena]|uniref:uncharacterized protein n=1 Tax=Penicillium lagena TaxID=94218 RepID=UPI00254055C8|nr:uncharacterized protein N7510_010637 [Penicillium lagena]KAJ5601103.1 hypothetical protein N7510_010637 [Penicillium lagena]
MTTPTPELATLPLDLFWVITSQLSFYDVARCRQVSRSWNEAFCSASILVPLAKRWFLGTPEADEIIARSSDIDNTECRRLFDQVASRWHRMSIQKPRSLQKYQLCDDFGSNGEREWFPIPPWESHASHFSDLVDRPFGEAMWTCADHLLVYPSAHHQCLVLMDLETDRHFMVPFIVHGKVVRRVRLQNQVLVVEWAEPQAFHWLNDSDGVHRHFASSFDVTRNSDDGWSIVPRNEWKIMFLGHPLSDRDRFFSSHTNTHYVIYMWQPNRSLYTADEDAPIESLFVWDISKPSSYRPSLDPTGSLRDQESDAPTVEVRFGFRDLEFFGIRQRGCPSIQRLEITDDAQALEITENITDEEYEWWPSSFTIVTSIPLSGYGPHRRHRVEAPLVPYRGNCSLQATPLGPVPLLWESKYPENILDYVYHPIDYASIPSFFFWVLLLSRNPETQEASVYLQFQSLHYPPLTHPNLDFAGRAKLCGGESYLVGENCNRELVIWRFDR